MAKLESYSNLTRKQDDLFKKGFVYNTVALVTFSHQTSGLLFKTRVGKRFQGPVISNISSQFKQGNVAFTPKRKTDGSHLFSYEYTPDKDNKLKGELKVVTEAGAIKSHEPTLSVEHSSESFRAKLALTSGPVVKLSSTFGKPEYGFGVDTKVALNALALPVLNLASWYNLSRTYSVFKAEGLDLAKRTLAKTSASLFLSVSPSVRVATSITFNLEATSATAEVAGEYELSENTLVKGKVDNTGAIGVALQQDLNSHVKLSLASHVASPKVISTAASDFKFGVRLDFTE